jgi:hypothetical protein
LFDNLCDHNLTINLREIGLSSEKKVMNSRWEPRRRWSLQLLP